MHARFSSAVSITVIEQIFVLDAVGCIFHLKPYLWRPVNILGIQPSKIQKLTTRRSNFWGKIVEKEIFPNDPKTNF